MYVEMRSWWHIEYVIKRERRGSEWMKESEPKGQQDREMAGKWDEANAWKGWYETKREEEAENDEEVTYYDEKEQTIESKMNRNWRDWNEKEICCYIWVADMVHMNNRLIA